MRKAKENMAGRQSKKDKKAGTGIDGTPDQPQHSMNSQDINNLSSSLGRPGRELQPGSDQKKRSINEFRVVSLTPSY